MTKSENKYVLRVVSQQTALLLTKYEDDYDLINCMYEDMLIVMAEYKELAYINYLTQIIGFLANREDYEYCIKLVDMKEKIKQLI